MLALVLATSVIRKILDLSISLIQKKNILLVNIDVKTFLF